MVRPYNKYGELMFPHEINHFIGHKIGFFGSMWDHQNCIHKTKHHLSYQDQLMDHKKYNIMNAFSSATASNENFRNKKIVIVGAGPSGLLLACKLLKRNISSEIGSTNGGYDIVVLDRRQDPRFQLPGDDTRSFPLSLQARGWNALPVELQSKLSNEGVWTVGINIHRADGKRRSIPKAPTMSIDRNNLALVLLEAVSELPANSNGNKVTLLFNTSFAGVDLDKKVISVTSNRSSTDPQRPPKTEAIEFDYLVAADGARSRIRRALAKTTQLEYTQHEIQDEYRTIHLLRQVPQSLNEDTKKVSLKNHNPPPTLSPKILDSDKIHIWMFKEVKMIVSPIHPKLVSGAFIFDKGQDPFLAMKTTSDVHAYFDALAPKQLSKRLTEEEAASLLARPTAGVLSVRCNQLHLEEGVLLLGDAAHAVSPSVGQGCNAALQDVQVFCGLLDQYGDDWDRALPAYTASRLTDAHAISEISDFASPRTPWMKTELVVRLILRKLLPAFLAAWVLRPMPMELVVESTLSYKEVLEKTKWWIDRVKASVPPMPLSPGVH